MFQLDEQGDMYENTKKELLILRSKADEYNLQVSVDNFCYIHIHILLSLFFSFLVHVISTCFDL